MARAHHAVAGAAVARQQGWRDVPRVTLRLRLFALHLHSHIGTYVLIICFRACAVANSPRDGSHGKQGYSYVCRACRKLDEGSATFLIQFFVPLVILLRLALGYNDSQKL